MFCMFHVQFKACAAIFGPIKCRFRRFWRSVGPSGQDTRRISDTNIFQCPIGQPRFSKTPVFDLKVANFFSRFLGIAPISPKRRNSFSVQGSELLRKKKNAHVLGCGLYGGLENPRHLRHRRPRERDSRLFASSSLGLRPGHSRPGFLLGFCALAGACQRHSVGRSM